MSYDLYLRDPVTRDTLQVPGHMMYGGNIKCDLIDNVLVPTTTTDAYLNITYNYSTYYYEAFPGNSEDPEIMMKIESDAEIYGISDMSGGIRCLNNMSGIQAVPFLQEMIRRIESKYRQDDKWIETERKEVQYKHRVHHGITKTANEMLVMYFDEKRRTGSEEKAEANLNKVWKKCDYTVRVNEGDTSNYWQSTAANALRPLYQLIALSRLRPDGVWSEES